MHHALLFLRMFLLSTTLVHKFKHGTWLMYYRMWLMSGDLRKNLSLLPFYPGTSRGGRPFSVHQYSYDEAVRSVMKREVG